MSRVILACALAGLLSVPAKADETLKYRSIWHTTFVQSQNIPDADGHVVAVIRNEGVASFPDGGTAIDNFAGTIDYTKGSGPAITYGDMTFSDGSVLFTKSIGTTTTEGQQTAFKAQQPSLAGKGRFSGAKGDGTFTGGRLQPQPGAGAHLYGDIILNVKK
jgi:hypothetical protein